MSQHDSDETFCARVLGSEERFDQTAAYRRQAATAIRRPNRLPYALAGALVAAAAVVLLFVAPIGSFAQSFLTIFQPKQFAAIDITSIHDEKRRLFPDLSEYGTLGHVRSPKSTAPASLPEASAAVGFHALMPSYIPASITGPHEYRANGTTVGSFTFRAVRAAASAARTKHALPPMPAGLDGTTITATVGPMLITKWGFHGRRSSLPEGPGLALVQSIAPTVRSSGASLADLEAYLLKMPGIPEQLADQIRAIGDPSSTLPIPILGAKQSAHPVDVDGASGLAIGDNTGIGSGVIWERDGKVYGVFGTLTEDEVLRVAASLR